MHDAVADRGDRARVDHRVVGTVVVVELDDAVERVPCRLDADATHHRLPTPILQRERVGEGLGERLDGEGLLVITHAEHLALDRDDRDTEPIAVRLRELGDVVSDPSFVARGVTGVEAAQRPGNAPRTPGVSRSMK